MSTAVRSTLALKSTVIRRQAEPIPSDTAERLVQLQHHQVAEAAKSLDAAAATPEPTQAWAKDLEKPPKRDQHVLQSAFLAGNLGKPILIFLINGIKLVGKLRQFDQFCLLLEAPDGAKQLIFKHAVSTIATPTRRPSPETDGNR